mmetsp:Transcript_77478/g.250726  ORF Transcript_77478/g.250726 Transcript_77478/m.250726 type:complete len:394 (-) Transcript_77478:456-1637(-)
MAVGVETLGLVLLGLASEDLAVEVLLHPLVAVIDQELLEAVDLKHLEAVEVQQTQRPRTRSTAHGRRDALGNAAREPVEERRVELLRQRSSQRGHLVLVALAEVALPLGTAEADGRLGLREEGEDVHLRHAQERGDVAQRLPLRFSAPRGAAPICQEGHGRDEAADLDDLGEPQARGEEALDEPLEAFQAHLGIWSIVQAWRRRQRRAADADELGPLGCIRQPAPECARRRGATGQSAQRGAKQVENVVGPLALRQISGHSRGLQHVGLQRRAQHLAILRHMHLHELAEARGVRVLPGLRVAEGRQDRGALLQALPDVVRRGVAHRQEPQHRPRRLRLASAALAGDKQGVPLAIVGKGGRGRCIEVRGLRRSARGVARGDLLAEGAHILVGVH